MTDRQRDRIRAGKSVQVPLSIILPTHGRSALLGRTLETVIACDKPAGYEGCVVVENGSRDGAEELVRNLAQRHPNARLRYRYVERANKSEAINVVLRELPSDRFVVFLDDDVCVAREVLVAYASAAVTNPHHAYFGGPSSPEYEVQPPEWIIPLFPPSARGVEIGVHGVTAVLGYNWAAWNADLLDLGGFDPRFGPGSPTGSVGQETQMMRRMEAKGFSRVSVPDAVVSHYVPKSRSSLRWLFKRMYRTGLSLAQFEREERSAIAISIEASIRAFRCAVVAPVRFVRRQPLEACRAFIGLSEAAGKIVGSTLRVG